MWIKCVSSLLLFSSTRCPSPYPQNHIMVKVGRDLEVILSTPLLNQGHSEQVAQDQLWSGFEYLKDTSLTDPCICMPVLARIAKIFQKGDFYRETF